MQIFNYIDTVIVFVVPFTAIVVLNSIIGYTVWKTVGMRNSMTLQRRLVFGVYLNLWKIKLVDLCVKQDNTNQPWNRIQIKKNPI